MPCHVSSRPSRPGCIPHKSYVEGERTKHGPLVHGPPLWTGSMDPLHRPGPWTPYFLFIFLFFISCFLFFFTIFLFFFYKKINHTKPNHNDWVHGHPIFPSFKISCKEILLCCFLLATRGGRLQQWDKMSLFCGTKCFC